MFFRISRPKSRISGYVRLRPQPARCCEVLVGAPPAGLRCTPLLNVTVQAPKLALTRPEGMLLKLPNPMALSLCVFRMKPPEAPETPPPSLDRGLISASASLRCTVTSFRAPSETPSVQRLRAVVGILQPQEKRRTPSTWVAPQQTGPRTAGKLPK